MKHHHGFLGFLCGAAWLITALQCLNVGFATLGWFNFYTLPFMIASPGFTDFVKYVVGVSGLWSIILFIKMVVDCIGGSCKC